MERKSQEHTFISLYKSKMTSLQAGTHEATSPPYAQRLAPELCGIRGSPLQDISQRPIVIGATIEKTPLTIIFAIIWSPMQLEVWAAYGRKKTLRTTNPARSWALNLLIITHPPGTDYPSEYSLVRTVLCTSRFSHDLVKAVLAAS
jgi:hypothetical protein